MDERRKLKRRHIMFYSRVFDSGEIIRLFREYNYGGGHGYQ
jgi:hypothetical protein